VFEIKSINSSISQNKMIRDKPAYQCPRFKYSLFIIKSDSESLYCFQLYDSQSLFADKTIKNKHRRQNCDFFIALSLPARIAIKTLGRYFPHAAIMRTCYKKSPRAPAVCQETTCHELLDRWRVLPSVCICPIKISVFNF